MFVKGLDRTWTSQTMMEVFDMYGDIQSAKVSTNPLTGNSNGYGFVLFKTIEGARKMIEAYQSGESPFIAEYFRPRSGVFKTFNTEQLNPVKIPTDGSNGEYLGLLTSFINLLGLSDTSGFSKYSPEFKP